jgi:hypothetical protein
MFLPLYAESALSKQQISLSLIAILALFNSSLSLAMHFESFARNNSFFSSFEEINEIISSLIYCSELEVNIGNHSCFFSLLTGELRQGRLI